MGGEAAADAADRAQVLVGLAGGQVGDVHAVEAGEVDGLAEGLGRLVEVGPYGADARVGVQVAGAGEQGADADAVQGTGGVRADPAAADQGLEQRVHRAARDPELVRQLLEACGPVAARGQQFQQVDRACRRLHLADAPGAVCLRHAPIVSGAAHSPMGAPE